MAEKPWSEALQQNTQERLESGRFMAHPVTNAVCARRCKAGYYKRRCNPGHVMLAYPDALKA